MTNNKRHHATVTMTGEMFQTVKAAAKAADQPLTVWVREAIKAELRRINQKEQNL